MEVICTECAVFDDDNVMIESYLPSYETEKEIEKILQDDPEIRDIWAEVDGNS